MRITQLENQLLRVPLARPVGSGMEPGSRLDHIDLLAVTLDTDAGHRGLGVAYSLAGGGRALRAIVEDDLRPLLLDEDPLDHERLGSKVYWRLQSIGRRGLVMQAYAAVDLALWDLKGKVAGQPLYKLLGGARQSAPVFSSDAGWLWMNPDEIVEAARPYLEQEMMGIKVQVGSKDPEADAERVSRVREVLGDDLWLAVDAGQRYDYATALSMGTFFEEELGADWFEEPISCEDVEGHSRLATRLDLAIVAGAMLFGADEFRAYLDRDAAAILSPDIIRLGGLTRWLKVAALAEAYHRPIVPHLLPEVAVHLACGLPQVQMVEHVPWFAPAFVGTPAIVKGQIVPSSKPGLGLELRDDAIDKYRIDP